MVSVEHLDQVTELEVGFEEPNTTLTQQAPNILEKAESGPSAEQPKTAQLFYTVPIAGVRYYLY